MSFNRIIGQEYTVNFLKNSIARDRVAHAYIFLGPKGVGRMTVACEFAKALNCAKDGNDACDECPSCGKIDALAHPDVFIYQDSEDETAGIKIDQVRALVHEVNMKPHEGKKKVFVIDQAESMRHEAANALLKTLEEPSRDSIIILIAERLGSLPPTVASRSQVVRFSPIATDMIAALLVKDCRAEATKAKLAARLSSGSPGHAFSMVNKDGFFEARERVIGMLQRGGGIKDAVSGTREEAYDILDSALGWYRDILILKKTGARKLLIHADKHDIIQAIASGMDASALERILEEIFSAIYALDRHAHPRLAMDVMKRSLSY